MFSDLLISDNVRNFAADYQTKMVVTFEKEYLKELYEDKKARNKKYRFQPQIIKKYTQVIDLMMEL